ncbi:MAG: cytoplasmic protein [Acidimicrobiaceae bacterium]|nr:cytoplasmic protein [Acidimicrobiaceae bacterium]|tara:strand:- start:13665 stop:14879 length:1215 start_codon:yes stop_codon:yes gene_type:complete
MNDLVPLTAEEARKINLGAQGFSHERTPDEASAAELESIMNAMKVVQLDAVPIVVRTQYLPFFSRLGNYEMSLYEEIAYKQDKWFELWAHEASIAPVKSEPFFRFIKDRAKKGETWKGLYKVATEEPEYVKTVLEEVKQRGPLEAKHLNDPRYIKKSGWGSRSVGQLALNWLYRIGEVGIRRGNNFEKKYDLISNIVPSEILSLPSPTEEESLKKLYLWATSAMGVASARDIQDYFRTRSSNTRTLLQELQDEGLLTRVEVEGWGLESFAISGFGIPKEISPTCFLSPFDPIIWNRERLRRIFGFDYKLEIYKPKSKREFGYYVLPFMHNGQIVARVDLANRRQTGVLEVLGAFCEPSYDRGAISKPLWEEISLLATFVGCPVIQIKRRGNLSQPLRIEQKMTK